MVQFIGENTTGRSYQEHPSNQHNYFITITFKNSDTHYQCFLNSSDWMKLKNSLDLITNPIIDEDAELTFNLKAKINKNKFYYFISSIPNDFDISDLDEFQKQQLNGNLRLSEGMGHKKFQKRKTLINLSHIDEIFLGWDGIAAFDAKSSLPDKIELKENEGRFSFIAKNKVDNYMISNQMSQKIINHLTDAYISESRIIFEDCNQIEYSIFLSDLSLFQIL